MSFTSVTIPSAFSDADAIAALLVDATSDPLISGSVADGSEDTASRKDHVHPLHHTDIHTVAKHTVDSAMFAQWANFTK
jgi:hypothetical protein